MNVSWCFRLVERMKILTLVMIAGDLTIASNIDDETVVRDVVNFSGFEDACDSVMADRQRSQHGVVRQLHEARHQKVATAQTRVVSPAAAC